MAELRDFFFHLGIFDLRFRGNYHTWTNKRPRCPITEKLDRLLVNNTWIVDFPDSVATFSAPGFSDHSHCILDLACPLPCAGTKPFRFFNFLTKHNSFSKTVEVAWAINEVMDSSLSSFCLKLKSLKRCLKTLNKENFSNI